MDCPVCKSAMVTVELREVEIDYCPRCEGIWLDRGELQLLLADKDKARELLDSFEIVKGSGEAVRKCPICLKKMEKINIGGGQTPVMIDKCRKNDGLWFDKGELQQIFKNAKLDAENRIQELLAEVFGNPGQPVKQ